MRKLLLYTGIFAISMMGVVSCGPSKAEREEKARQDSIRVADSLAVVEAKRVEKAKQDSIEKVRQDSIRKVEEFVAKVPSFGKVFNNYNLSTYLKGLGFTRSKRGAVTFEGGEEVTTYTLSLDATHYCTIQEGRGIEWLWYKYTLVGFPEKWTEIKSEATAQKGKWMRNGAGAYFKINGNTISWGDGA